MNRQLELKDIVFDKMKAYHRRGTVVGKPNNPRSGLDHMFVYVDWDDGSRNELAVAMSLEKIKEVQNA